MNSLHSAIVSDLENSADLQHAEKDKRYHKYDGHKSYGIKAPVVDRILKKYKQDIVELNCDDALAVAKKLFASRIEEQLGAGSYILSLKLDCLTLPRQEKYLDQLAENFISWSTVDDFCISVLQPILFKHPNGTFRLLRKWNTSRNMWKRRASVVAFVRKAGESGWFTKEVIELCDNLKRDSEDLVQKGIGWALKDAMRGDKGKVLNYVKQLRREGVSSTVTLYAIRDLKGSERQGVLRTNK